MVKSLFSEQTDQMKTSHTLEAIIAAALMAATSNAATVISNYDNSTGESDPAFPYIDKVIMTANDTWTDSVSVGGWSFRDLRSEPAPNPSRGWGHSSAWFLLEVTQPAEVTIAMLSADPTAWAGFVIYSGESIDDTPDNAHTYSNDGLDFEALNSPWDQNGPGGTAGLGYVGNGHEVASAPGTSGTFDLAPGVYTIAFGNAADSLASPTAKTFDLSITTVPEPSAAMLSALTVACFAAHRRRA